VRCSDGQLVVEHLKAAAGAGKLECKATAELPDVENNFTAEVTAYHLPIDKELAEKMPAKVQLLYEYFKPSGTAKFQFLCDKKRGQWRRHYFLFEPDEISVCFWKFPYPIDQVTGQADYDFLKAASKFDLVGYSGSQPIHVQGYWKGQDLEADALIEIAADDIPFDQKLLRALEALSPKIKEVAQSFHPVGRGHIRGTIRRVPGAKEYPSNYHIRVVDSSIKWDEFPYPLENVDGDLLVSSQNCYEFKNFHGSHHGGDVWVEGRTMPRDPSGGESKLVVTVAGQNICLDEDLHNALVGVPKMTLGKGWDMFAPAGRIGFRAEIERLPNQQRDLDITVNVAGCAIEPSFFPYALQDVTGQFRCHNNKVDFTSFTARHNNSQISIADGTVDLSEKGGYHVELRDLRGNPVLADEGFLRALPKLLRSTCEGIKLKDQPFAIHLPKLVVSQMPEPGSPPQVYWEGLFWVRDAELRAGLDLNHVTGTVGCRGLYDGKQISSLLGNVYFNDATIFKQPFQGVRGQLIVSKDDPDLLHFHVEAPIFGGDLAGQGWLEFDSRKRFEIDLTASQIQLAEFGRHNLGPKHELNGLAAARLHLQGQAANLDGLDDLEGNGSVDVPYSPLTRLLNLPFLLDLLKFLGLRVPDQTAFEEAHAAFAIHGKRASIHKLELLGNAISLYGKGEVNLDGTDLDLSMYSSPGRVEQMLPGVLRNIPSAISKQLLKIDVRGKIGGAEGDLKFSRRPVPVLLDPLVELHNRFVGKQ
jgi:hypothetical protein